MSQNLTALEKQRVLYLLRGHRPPGGYSRMREHESMINKLEVLFAQLPEDPPVEKAPRVANPEMVARMRAVLEELSNDPNITFDINNPHKW